MNLQFYFEKLYESEEFQKFKKDFPSAFLVGGFVVIDKENSGVGNKIHFDYYEPDYKKMTSFQLEKEVTSIPVEQVPDVANKLADNIDFDFQKIEDLILDKMEQEKIKKNIQKILFSLQNIEGINYLLGTIFISGLGMIKINIELDKMKITDFQNKSFLDMINVFKR